MEFVSVDMGAAGAAEAGAVVGEMQPAASSHMRAPAVSGGGGLTSRFLANKVAAQPVWATICKMRRLKGYGWLLELEGEKDEALPPLLEELDIDVRDIYYKIRCVLLPIPALGFQRQIVRDNPDFWGPLFVVLVYALLSLYGQMRVVSWIITIWFAGSFLIYVLVLALGGANSFSQTLGVIGYSLLPLIITGALLPLMLGVPILALAVKSAGVLWAAFSAGSLLVPDSLEAKRVLVLYPILILFVYFFSLYDGA